MYLFVANNNAGPVSPQEAFAIRLFPAKWIPPEFFDALTFTAWSMINTSVQLHDIVAENYFPVIKSSSTYSLAAKLNVETESAVTSSWLHNGLS